MSHHLIHCLGFATNTSQNPSFNAFKSMTQMETNDNPLKSSLSSTQTNGGRPATTPRTDSTEEMTTEDADDVYNNKLSELNKCFFQHINGYMSRSEFFDFTQVCKEYIEYHQKIESESKQEVVTTTTPSAPPPTVSSSSYSGSSGGLIRSQISSGSYIPSPSSLPSTYSTSSAPFQSSQSVFGSQSTTSSQSSSPIATSQTSANLFSSQTSAKSDEKPSVFAKPNIQFGLSASKPSTTEPSPSETTSTAADETTEESDEPPKVESVEHKEPDSVFSRKYSQNSNIFYFKLNSIKIYFILDVNYISKKATTGLIRGFGYLYIKKETTGTAPAQLLIRADNKLGVILLHISLNESLPISKAPQNKGIYLSCIPNPPLDPKATTQTTVTFLIKVRTEDTEELFDKLIKYKSNQ